ncbi:Golgi-resident adenosine 3',5'-bisphosphate 3'-phosphatase [Lemmus lemmus]
MAPMGIRLSPLGVAVFFLLGLGVLYHLYSGVLACRFSLFGLGGEPVAGGAARRGARRRGRGRPAGDAGRGGAGG